jgi:hypothetical protein
MTHIEKLKTLLEIEGFQPMTYGYLKDHEKLIYTDKKPDETNGPFKVYIYIAGQYYNGESDVSYDNAIDLACRLALFDMQVDHVKRLVDLTNKDVTVVALPAITTELGNKHYNVLLTIDPLEIDTRKQTWGPMPSPYWASQGAAQLAISILKLGPAIIPINN